MAFERGSGGLIDIYLPWEGFNCVSKIKCRDVYFPMEVDLDIRQETFEMLRDVLDMTHYYNIIKRFAYRCFHCRNVLMVLGPDLESPSEFLICWSPWNKSKSGVKGGTNTAYQIAVANNIPVYNFFDEGSVDRLFREQLE